MFKNPPKLRLIIDQLISESRLEPADQNKIIETLVDLTSKTRPAWYIQGLVGLSGWVAALFFIGFLATLEVLSGELEAISFGVVFCVVSIGLKRIYATSIFLGQLTLAFSLAGQALFIGGLSGAIDQVWLVILITILFEGLLVVLYPDSLHRLISSLIIWAAMLFFFIDLELEELTHLVVILLAGGILFIWHNEARLTVANLTEFYRPIGYSLPLALFGFLLFSLTDELSINYWWISAGGLLIVLLALEYLIFSQPRLNLGPTSLPWIWGATALLIIPAVQTPGLLAAIFVLLLGFYRGNRLLIGLATAFLAVFLIGYYYNLDLSLLTKSYVLTGTGLVLFFLQYGLGRWVDSSVEVNQ